MKTQHHKANGERIECKMWRSQEEMTAAREASASNKLREDRRC